MKKGPSAKPGLVVEGASNSIVLNFVEEINAAETGSAIRCPGKTDPSQAGFSAVSFAHRMDAILDLLDSTAVGLAAAWNMQAGTSPEGDFEPTIH